MDPQAPTMKLEYGDAFEVQNASWLRQYLPHYEPVWAAFIGHNGRGWPCQIPDLETSLQQNRKRFYEAHYSFPAKLKSVQQGATCFAQDLGEIKDPSQLEPATERLFNIMAAVGYVRDMFKRIDDALATGGSLFEPLNSFYAERSHVIHGPRMPYRISDGLLQIPEIGGENKLFGEWDDKSTWDSIPDASFVYVADYAEHLSSKLFVVVNQVHGKVFDAADRRFEGRRIAVPSSFPPEEWSWPSAAPPRPSYRFPPPASGTI